METKIEGFEGQGFTTCLHRILQHTDFFTVILPKLSYVFGSPRRPTKSAKTTICIQISALKLPSHLSCLTTPHTVTVKKQISLNERAICTRTSSRSAFSCFIPVWHRSSRRATLMQILKLRDVFFVLWGDEAAGCTQDVARRHVKATTSRVHLWKHNQEFGPRTRINICAFVLCRCSSQQQSFSQNPATRQHSEETQTAAVTRVFCRWLRGTPGR